MIELFTYAPDAMPDVVRYQILAYMRVEWTQGFTGRWRGRRWISRPEYNPTHFVLMDDGFVVAHTESMWQDWRHAGVDFRVYGLSGVFVYPDYRGEGYGQQIVERATAHIRRQPDADIGMLWCEPHLQPFYTRCGWDHMATTQTLIGETRESAQVDPESLFMCFFSAKGKAQRTAFEDTAIYFGWTTW